MTQRGIAPLGRAPRRGILSGLRATNPALVCPMWGFLGVPSRPHTGGQSRDIALAAPRGLDDALRNQLTTRNVALIDAGTGLIVGLTHGVRRLRIEGGGSYQSNTGRHVSSQ